MRLLNKKRVRLLKKTRRVNLNSSKLSKGLRCHLKSVCGKRQLSQKYRDLLGLPGPAYAIPLFPVDRPVPRVHLERPESVVRVVAGAWPAGPTRAVRATQRQPPWSSRPAADIDRDTPESTADQRPPQVPGLMTRRRRRPRFAGRSPVRQTGSRL